MVKPGGMIVLSIPPTPIAGGDASPSSPPGSTPLVVQYYLNGGSRVYAILLDASQAFDRVHFIKMFKLLLDRGLCPLVCRLLVKPYTQQSARVKCGGAISDEFKVSNGVKQGGVLSPILFGVYMDELFKCLRSSQAGCHVGQRFMGAFGYADNVILLAPTKHSMHTMKDKCMLFSSEFQV